MADGLYAQSYNGALLKGVSTNSGDRRLNQGSTVFHLDPDKLPPNPVGWLGCRVLNFSADITVKLQLMTSPTRQTGDTIAEQTYSGPDTWLSFVFSFSPPPGLRWLGINTVNPTALGGADIGEATLQIVERVASSGDMFLSF